MLVDSKAYTFDDNHKATAASPDTPLAFAMLCLFTPENRVVNPNGGDTIENLRDTFKKGKFDYDGINNPVPFAVRGAFSSVKTTKGELKGVQGTIFGFAVPAWMESLSGPGVRCCFLSGCRTIGGEVLDYSSTRGTFVEWAM
jgi:alpha-acetolactate decarboxylase